MEPNAILNTLQSIEKTLGNGTIVPLVASGGLTLWVISNIKNIFNVLRDAVVSLISFNVFNTYEDCRTFGYDTKVMQSAFNRIITNSRTIWERNVNLDLQNGPTRNPDSDELDKMLGLESAGGHKTEMQKPNDRTITYGFSMKIVCGRLVFCNRSYKQESQKIVINTSMRVFFSSKKRFMEELNSRIDSECRKITAERNSKNDVWVYYGSENYGRRSTKNRRCLDSIFTNNGEHYELYKDIRKFIDNRKTYETMNYPYKYSALLEGVPGSGKSSTILAIASELGRDVEYVNLSRVTVEMLMDKINDNTANKIFVFEDIDALNSSSVTNRDSDKENENGIREARSTIAISLSDLLNVTDGLLSSDGAICLFTTNHAEKLDPALLRAGRMNKIVRFEYMNKDTANSMIRRYLGFEVDGLKDEIKPAELQECIMSILLGTADRNSLDAFRKPV